MLFPSHPDPNADHMHTTPTDPPWTQGALEQDPGQAMPADVVHPRKRSRSQVSPDHCPRGASSPSHDRHAPPRNAQDTQLSGAVARPAKRFKSTTSATDDRVPMAPTTSVSLAPQPATETRLALPSSSSSTPYHPWCWFCPEATTHDPGLMFTPRTGRDAPRFMYGAVAKGPVLPGHIMLAPRVHLANWHCIDPSARVGSSSKLLDMAMAALTELAGMQAAATHRYLALGQVPVAWQVFGHTTGATKLQHAYCQMVGVPGESAQDKHWARAVHAQLVAPWNTADNKVQLVRVRSQFTFKALDTTPSLVLVDRIVRQLAAGLAPAMVYEFKVSGAALLASLTRTLHVARALAPSQVKPMCAHAAVLVGDRLVFAQAAAAQEWWTVPRRALVAALRLDKARGYWKLGVDPEVERKDRKWWADGWADDVGAVGRRVDKVERDVDVAYFSLGGWTRGHVGTVVHEEEAGRGDEKVGGQQGPMRLGV